jgi:hypothetical protein
MRRAGPETVGGKGYEETAKRKSVKQHSWIESVDANVNVQRVGNAVGVPTYYFCTSVSS